MPEPEHAKLQNLFITSFQVNHKLEKILLEEIKAFDLNLTQYRALEEIAHKDPTSLVDIQHQLGIASSTLSSAVDSLSQRGLIRKNRDPNDLRTLEVYLTDKGTEVVTQIFTTSCERLEPLLETHPAYDFDHFMELQSRLLDFLEKM
ncbi:hypothetical protein IV38_GL001263 [Lactobacillus selangorensis]|uniref:HTH marR-type domain-containing protein n=1 Tax=Lactobacillus selangorensis TaxID=81857 RepID=A0A0R2FNG8_9LACO|nr:MarR family transcriptional regulator [Lactobacillus selangorensis]KRN29047.1 hypothetical protein IV38_GL001263 [Lactobacillus selangorensis]KRN30040.1 hypothetical protein IV40_GL002069 [Lactobacillus selangorensis]